MPTATEIAEAAEAPALGLQPQITNPVLDDTNIKAMSAKFRENFKRPGTTDPNPMPQMRLEPTPKPVEPAKEPAPAPTPEPAPTPDPAKAPEAEPSFDEKTVPSIARENFKRLEQSRQQYKKQVEEGRKVLESQQQQLKELQERAQRYEAAGVDPEAFIKTKEERDRLAKEHEQAIQQLETVNLERSPRFQNWWNTETKKHLLLAAKHAPEHAQELEKLLLEESGTERNAAIDKIVDNLPPTSRRLVERAMEAIEVLKTERQEALQRGSERWKEMQAFEATERSKAESQKQARSESLAQAALKRAESMSAFQPDPNDPEHNNEIAARKEFVRAIVQGRVDEDVALNVPAAAVEYIHLSTKVVPRLREELAKANEIIKQLQGSGPRRADGNSPSQQQASDSKPGEGFAAKMKELWPGKR